MNYEKKKKMINDINRVYRTILSYGEDDTLIPLGEFIVKDIVTNESQEDLEKNNKEFDTHSFILTKVDDENVRIILPAKVFISQFIEMAERNAEKLELDTDLTRSIKDVIDGAEQKILMDKTLHNLTAVDALPLKQIEGEYFLGDEMQSSNYSICPIDLSKYIVRVRELEVEKKEKKEKNENEKTIPYYDYIVSSRKKEERKEERKPYPEIEM